MVLNLHLQLLDIFLQLQLPAHHALAPGGNQNDDIIVIILPVITKQATRMMIIYHLSCI